MKSNLYQLENDQFKSPAKQGFSDWKWYNTFQHLIFFKLNLQLKNKIFQKHFLEFNCDSKLYAAAQKPCRFIMTNSDNDISSSTLTLMS